MDIGFVWECKCGRIEHNGMLPEDCPKCFRVGGFSKVPEDMIEEKKAEEVLSTNLEAEDED